MEERRKFQRLNWSVEVHWKKFETPSRPLPESATVSKDISAGGIRLILRGQVSPGDILELEIRLGGGKDIRTKARVVWVDTFTITGGKEESAFEGGVEFIDMSDETRKLIESFVMESRNIK